jgi:hypothetical protein
LTINGKESLYLLKEVIPIGIEGEKRIIEISLKNTIGTIHWTVGDGIDHIITTADMLRGPWTGLQTPSVKTGNEEMSFAFPNGIWHGRKLLNQRPLVLNPLYRNIRKGL